MSLFTFYAQNIKACIIPAGIVSILVSDSTLGCDISIVSDVDKFETPQIYTVCLIFQGHSMCKKDTNPMLCNCQPAKMTIVNTALKRKTFFPNEII